MTPAERIVQFVLSTDYFTGRTPAIPSLWVKGRSRVFLVLGPNGAGKSVFRRLVIESARARSRSVQEVIHLSMQGRASGGPMRALIYGSEDWQATGEITAHTLTMAQKTCAERTHDHFLYWDEPDIGLSDEAVAGAAAHMVAFAEKAPAHTRAIFVTSHNRTMVGALASLLPHYIHLGVPISHAPPTLVAWLSRSIEPIEPEEVTRQALARFAAIKKVMNHRKRKRARGQAKSHP